MPRYNFRKRTDAAKRIDGIKRTGEVHTRVRVVFPARVWVSESDLAYSPKFAGAYNSQGVHIGFGKIKQGTFRLEDDGRTSLIAGFIDKDHPFES